MSTTRDDLQALVNETLRDLRAATVDELGAIPLLWLAAPPIWTLSAAEAAGFPSDSVPGFIERARAFGWCESRGSAGGQGSAELRFWMPDEVRREVIGMVVSQLGFEATSQTVARIANDLAPRLLFPAQPPGIQSAGALEAWARVVAHDSPGVVGGRVDLASRSHRLIELTRKAVEDGELAPAQDLVAACEAIAAVFGGTAEQALSRTRRLLALGMRRRQDERALARYLDRPELSDAVTRLLDPSASQWALHLRGVGGVGKTMLIRYLASGRYAHDRGDATIPVARVDFDHISPDYPVRRPIQLLIELADELALHAAASERADRALRAFRDDAIRAHEAVSGLRDAGGRPLDSPEAQRAVDGFAQVISELGGALLILDTCEELAKADAGNPGSPAIQATLDMVERLHDKAGSVRVLLAGRRRLPERDYLAVVQVAGFTVEEARRYLASGGRPLPPDLVDAMIRQSPAVDHPGRVSPFDLALYRSWAEENPGLTVADVARGSDAYVEGRIIERLDNPLVTRALPLLAVGGKCRVDTLASVLDCGATALGQRLAEQEWITATGDPPVHVTAQPALARRLRRYFEAPERIARFTSATTRLAGALVERVRTVSPDIDVDELLTVLRLLPPADAAALWDDIADHAVSDANWNWLLNVSRRVLGESQDDQWPTASALRASATAALIAASRRAYPLFAPEDPWREVLEWADRHPDPDRAYRLHMRALLGLLPWDPANLSLREELERAGGRLTAELVVTAADCLHQLLEFKMAGPTALPRWTSSSRSPGFAAIVSTLAGLISGAVSASSTLAPAVGPKAVACALITLARLEADGDQGGVLERLLEAEDQASREASHERPWPDFIPPDDVLARSRIERGLIAPQDVRAGELDAWEAYAAQHITSIDGERLAALCLRIRLQRGLVEPAVIQRLDAVDSYVPGRAGTCSAHDLVPPLFAVLAEAWLAAGQPEVALTILDQRRQEALRTRDDEATVRHADAETIRITRRLRLGDQRSLLSRLSQAGPDYVPWDDLVNSARRAMAVAYGELPAVGPEAVESPAGWHAWWQSRRATDIREFIVSPDWSAESYGTELAEAIDLDFREMRAVLGALNRTPQRLQSAISDWLARPRELRPPARSADPYLDVRAGLRHGALTKEPYLPRGEVAARVLAEIAFEEAELLALRLPDAAARLFKVAADSYAECGDHIGRLLALISMGADVSAELDVLRSRNPALAATFSGPLEDSGPWRYWVTAVQREAGLRPQWAASPSEVSGGPRRGWRDIASAIALASAGSIVMLLPAFMFVVIVVIIFPSINVTFLGAFSLCVLWAGAAIGWRLPRVIKLAAERGVGASRPGTLLFDAKANGTVSLSVRLRSLHGVPFRLKMVMWIDFPWTRLLARIRSKRRRGYEGVRRADSPLEAGQVDWAVPRPWARRRWWRRGQTAAIGVIRASRDEQGHLWEHIIATSLGPNAAGRIEWIRPVPAGPRRDTYEPGAALHAPPTWAQQLRGGYPPASIDQGAAHHPGPRVRHAIGRAVATSAGPCIDVSGGWSLLPPGESLLGVRELTRGQPFLVVLQAEPIDEATNVGLHDDLGEKAKLATELADDGVQAVLLLPTLPAGILPSVARAIDAYAEARVDPRLSTDGVRPLLLRPLRKVLAPYVQPGALDNVIIFLSEREPGGS